MYTYSYSPVVLFMLTSLPSSCSLQEFTNFILCAMQFFHSLLYSAGTLHGICLKGICWLHFYADLFWNHFFIIDNNHVFSNKITYNRHAIWQAAYQKVMKLSNLYRNLAEAGPILTWPHLPHVPTTLGPSLLIETVTCMLMGVLESLIMHSSETLQMWDPQPIWLSQQEPPRNSVLGASLKVNHFRFVHSFLSHF